MAIRVVIPPTGEQISLDEARLHLRVTPDENSPGEHPDDPLIRALISAARDYVERRLFRALCPQTIEFVADEFPTDAWIELPMAPVNQIISVAYTDAGGVSTPFATYDSDLVSEPARLSAGVGSAAWPSTQVGYNVVRVRYTAGYSLPGESPDNPMPSSIKAAMLLLIANWYENREAVVVGTIAPDLSFAVDILLKPHQLRMSMA